MSLKPFQGAMKVGLGAMLSDLAPPPICCHSEGHWLTSGLPDLPNKSLGRPTLLRFNGLRFPFRLSF
jgi:hypothetical protein